MAKIKPITDMKTEPIKDLVPEFKDTTTLQQLAELAKVKMQTQFVKKNRDQVSQYLGGVTDKFEDIIAHLEAEGVTEKDIAGMTDEQIEAYYTLEDGTPISIDLPMESKEREIEFKRDYLEMLFRNKVHIAEIDQKLEELDQMNAEFDQEIRQLHADTNGDIIKHVRNELEKQMNAEDADPAVVKNIKQIVDTIDDTYSLDSLYEYYSKYDPKNTIQDFLHRNDDIFKRFVNNCRRNGIVVNYRRFNLFEARYLDERFHKYSEFLPFLVIKMYSYKKQFNRLDSIFLLQLNANLQLLFYEHERGMELNEKQLEERAKMIAGIERVLSLFM